MSHRTGVKFAYSGAAMLYMVWLPKIRALQMYCDLGEVAMCTREVQNRSQRDVTRTREPKERIVATLELRTL
jgi:hypothetical protein